MNFYKRLSEYYDVIFPLNKQSVSFIKEQTKKGSLLDVGAGTGNHAIAFAELGHRVTATDLDENMLGKISEKAMVKAVNVEVLLVPMEQLEQLAKRSFTTITCLGNSLVHLKDVNEVRKTMQKMFNLLEENGILFIQIVNYDRVLQEGITELPFITRENNQVTFKRTYKIEENKILFQGLLTVGDETYENEIPILPITSELLENNLKDVGFSSIRKYGSFKGEAFKLDSPALIVVAAK